MQTQGNVQSATEGQLDEVRIGLSRSVNKLRGRLVADVAQQWVGDSGAMDALVEGLLVYKPRFVERDGMIYFSLTSNGKTGKQWVSHLKGRGFRLSRYSEEVLRSEAFKPTLSGTMHQIAVLKGESFSDENRVTKKIRAEAAQRKLSTPHPEVGPLFRDVFSDGDIERMGLIWVVVMHDPIKDSDGGACLLRANRNDDGSWLDTAHSNPEYRWYREDGFAFSVSQETSASVPGT